MSVCSTGLAMARNLGAESFPNEGGRKAWSKGGNKFIRYFSGYLINFLNLSS